jgi:hypothetical protein
MDSDVRWRYIISFTASVNFDVKILHFVTLHQLPIPYFATTMSNLSTFVIITANIAGFANRLFQRFVAWL